MRVGDHVKQGERVATLEEHWQRDESRIAWATRAFSEAESERRKGEAKAADERLRRAEALARDGLASGADLALARQDEASARFLARSAQAQRSE